MNDSEAGPSIRTKEYFDVFLNHRGPDSKATFVAHLDQALTERRFSPFLDCESLVEGKHNEKSIYEALDMAKVHVAVVSKRYAESKYCLNELVAIMKSGKPVIPVFYDVEFDDLLDVEKGNFAEAFKKHKKEQTSQEKLQEWIDALGWLAKIVGFCFDTTSRDRNEAKLKQNVVNAVAREFPRGPVFFDENRRVGLEESRKEVVRKLESGRIGVVGLYGMGGIGKTTLAEAVYEYCAEDFGHRSFLRDVRSSGTLTLQKQLIKDLRLGMEVNSCEDYLAHFRKFENLKVLIVVDDIDDERQFQDIIPDFSKIGESSRIIVTSRNKRVLSNVLLTTEKESRVLHEVEVLNRMESQELFNFRAFPCKLPDRGFEDLALQVAAACGGHPLALEIAGAFLRNKKNLETDRVLWDEMIASRATWDEKLQSILKISYDNGLDNCQKTMFLDISCHLIGEPRVVAVDIWASCASCSCEIHSPIDSRLRDLMEKCLVKLDTDGRLGMHDVLRDMGRCIVEDAVAVVGFMNWDRSHFWDPGLAGAVLEDRKGSDKVRGFSIARQDEEGDSSIPTYDAEAFSKMSALHLLVLDGCHVSGDFSKWSRELRLLQWRFFPLSALPLELNLAKTAVVDLSGSRKLKRLWKDETPLKKASRMVYRCFSQEVDDVQAHIMLRRLILNDCRALTTLSQDIGKRLPKLKVLELGNCIMLESLPDSIGEMKDLEQLILYYCRKLRSIPHTVVRLKKLKHLDLSLCSKLEMLPNVIANLGTLTTLTTLKLKANFWITELPESFTGLISLVHLKMKECPELRTVKALPHSLRRLHLGNCRKLDHLPSFEGLTSLAALTLYNCRGLEEIQGLNCLTTLEKVDLIGCTSMRPSTVQLQHNRGMHSCYLSGSNVAVKYDNDWLESEPTLQLITYYDNAFGFVDDGLVQRVWEEGDCDKVCMEATVVGENKCVAVVICCVAHDQGWSEDKRKKNRHYRSGCFLDAWIVREDQEVFRSPKLITFMHADHCNQVYVCTLRSSHPLVKVLEHGDQIRIATGSIYVRWAVTVKKCAICVVHGHGEDQAISVNSRLLDVQQSREKKAEFAGLIFADNPEFPDDSNSGYGSDIGL